MEIAELNKTRLIMADDTKFKSFNIIISFITPLGDEYASLNSLLVNVLKNSSEKYPTKEKLSLALDGMYGAQLDGMVQKRGAHLMPSLVFDFVSSKYADSDQMRNAFSLAEELLFHPLTDCEMFDRDVVETERENTIRHIRSVINDKRQYALEKCLEYTCGDDAYGKSAYGNIDICRKITPSQLYQHYKYIINNCKANIIIAGDFDKGIARELCASFSEKIGGGGEIVEPVLIKNRKEPQYIKETSDITQGKLVMSFTTDVGEGENACVESVLNGIFGGTVSSKLFSVVREKMSLCYYASSRYDKAKGLIIAQCGINCENYQKTVDAVLDQLKAVQNGDYTDEEFENTVSSLVANTKMSADSLYEMMAFYQAQSLREMVYEPSEMIKKYRGVTRGQISDISKLITLNTVYFLCGEKEISNE